MGAKDSKRACLCYEDAVKRISDAELKRICATFNRLTGGGQLMSQNSFTQHVLGDWVPLPVASSLYFACGGTNKGIYLRDLICGLVLLTKGSYDEKIKFLWSLYCNETGSHIYKTDFQRLLQLECCDAIGITSSVNNSQSLFSYNNDKATFEEFRAWIGHNSCSTVLSRWLLTESTVSIATEQLNIQTFYQTLAGVTHLEESDISDLEKSFWLIQSTSPSGQLDLTCISGLISPPVPVSACQGLFCALDVNRDQHIDFKELCCGVSAACRGPTAERVKFCFKMFDLDQDGRLNSSEIRHMLEILLFVAKDLSSNSKPLFQNDLSTCLESLEPHLTSPSPSITPDNDITFKQIQTLPEIDQNNKKFLTQESFLLWGTETCSILTPFLELLFQICHVSLGLRPKCRHDEKNIVLGWLEREQKRGYQIGQFWYLVSYDWWKKWLGYTSQPEVTSGGVCTGCGAKLGQFSPEEGLGYDDSLTSNSTESIGDLIKSPAMDNCSLASSSGISSSSGSHLSSMKSKLNIICSPGPIDNSNLIIDSQQKITSLTGEGGKLKRDRTLVQHRDFELLPDSLWKALAHWYGGPLPLPRQVIRAPNSSEVDLELYPLNLKILRHQQNSNQSLATSGNISNWGGVVGGYGAAALSSAGLTGPPPVSPRRYLAYTAAFSKLATVGQVLDFLSQRLSLKQDDLRLWHMRESNSIFPSITSSSTPPGGASPHNSPSHHSNSAPLRLLDNELVTLQDLCVKDGDQILLEVRNADLTWPEELGALVAGAKQQDRAPEGAQLPPGATGLHNLGNTCFMNAALQAVSNTKPLTMYFRRDISLCELNQSNPLGTRGQVARRYSSLLHQLWTSGARSIAPLKLRWCVARHAPHLGGGGQHDSQELLAWLLDALHEDLNRVTGKRYTELSDSGGRPDAEVAAEAWKQHLARDHSVITDLFYGQLKSKVTCQTCGHESVRFDPFNVLSLPLPMDSYTLCEVLVIKLDGSVPVKYGVRLNSESKYSELKEKLQKLSGVSAKNLALAEVAEAQIRQIISDQKRVNPSTALDLMAYELEESIWKDFVGPLPNSCIEGISSATPPSSPRHIRSPENTQQMRRSFDQPLSAVSLHRLSTSSDCRRPSLPPAGPTGSYAPRYITAVHRKCVRQDNYFVTQHRTRSVLFGVPLVLAVGPQTTTQGLYEAVWTQVGRLLSPVPQSDQTNHATDCDDSLGYEFPFTLRAVNSNGQICSICPWTKFCRGCALSCDLTSLYSICSPQNGPTHPSNSPLTTVAIDWEATALHLRYQSTRERTFIEDASVGICRRQQTEPVDLDHCLKAFTSEESLETRYHCSKCADKQPATKKLQIWRLPPILIIHLKRFDYVNGKWVKTHKVVNFPFTDFDPTAYLATVPHETILRHRAIRQRAIEPPLNDKKQSEKENDKNDDDMPKARRDRLESTSLLRTPIVDEALEDFHMHHLKEGQDPFDIKYQLYAVVSHSGLLNGGHYISYACNPNGSWYCYNDSSCREVRPRQNGIHQNNLPTMDTSSAYMLFYEREGLDYAPYLPEVSPLGPNCAPPPDIEDGEESELRRQLCSLQ